MDKEKLEIMLTNSSKVVGSKQVLKGISTDTVRCVIVSLDADVEIRRKIVVQAQLHNVQVQYVQSKKRLGEMCGIDVSATAVGIIKSEA